MATWVTHWMRGSRKAAAYCDPFCEEYILNRKNKIQSEEQYSFLLGYYAHLITDAAFQGMIRDEKRVRDAWMYCKKNRCHGIYTGNRRKHCPSYLNFKRRI